MKMLPSLCGILKKLLDSKLKPMSQSLRRSQFITTYGVGTILEGPDGPRIIPTLANSDVYRQRPLSDFEITYLPLSQAILNGAGILRLPSNAELGLPDDQGIYNTESFPRWSLCPRHGILYNKTLVDRNNNRSCPHCLPHPEGVQKAWKQAHRQAIRFVRACPHGHLDDIDWVGMITHGQENCSPSYLLWEGGGGALRNINIRCPNCSQSINLGIAYSRPWLCSGRFPEEGTTRTGCTRRAKIVQRGAANLRLSEIKTALTIPPRSTNLHRLLEISLVQAVLLGQTISSKQQLLDALQPSVQRGLLRASIVAEIQNYSQQAISDAINDTVGGDLPDAERRLRSQEFEALRDAAANGAPPVLSSTPGAPYQFEVIRQQVRTMVGLQGHRLRVTPVNRLRVMMVQTGYRRLDPLNPPVDRVYDDGQRLWYPGMELYGEGIFIDLLPETGRRPQHFPLTGGAANAWFSAWRDPEGYGQHIQPEDRDQLHPVFVWWHTFAHRLINALAVDSGYSSAAVRERIFVDVNENSGEANGGILLYTAQPGGDGTLGGLVALVPEFEHVLAAAFRNIDACSNDPLCGEEMFAQEKYNGAACYACALVSETSCEHRNMRLDRNLLLDNVP